MNLTIDIDTMESRHGERLKEGKRGGSSSIMPCLVTFYQFNRLIQQTLEVHAKSIALNTYYFNSVDRGEIIIHVLFRG